MSETTELSETRRALLNKYVRGNLTAKKTEKGNIPRRDPEHSIPLSSGQQQLWLLAQLLSNAPVYTECVTIHLPGPLDVTVLEKSFNEILRRHEAWRTSFPVIDGQPVQVVHPHVTVPLPVIDLSTFPEDKREAEALRLAVEDAERPFDLANGPLLRPMLVRLQTTNHRLFLTLHHIIFDGFSLYQIFLPELRSLYDAFLAPHSGNDEGGKPSPLPDLPVQYADFAVWQRKSLQEDKLEEQLAYWKKQLEGISGHLDLPTDRPRPPLPTFRGSMHPFALSKELTSALKALSLQEGVTLYMLLVAAFQVLLARYTGQSDILLGTGVSDRKRPELQGLMGFFLNTVVLRTHLSDNPSFLTVLQRVREVTLEALAHQDIPFEHLVKVLQPERTLGQNPLFQVLISLEPPLSMQPSGWTLTQMDVETNTAKFDLSLELDDRPEGLIGRFEYSTDLFDTTTIDRLAEHWQTLLEGIVAAPEKLLSELPLMTEAERQQILVEWNATQTAYPEDRCVHQLFEDQVERAPNATALILEEQQMTYRELNVQANQLAHHLRQLNVGPEVLVGLCMDRSFKMIVGLLGILKAGGVYVPFDPTYPKERLAFMLQDTQLSVLVTQEQYVDLLPYGSDKSDPLRVICLDTDWDAIAQQSTENLDNCTTSDNLAYVMYTSGSTGKPKGTEIRHRSINRLVFGVDYAQLDATRTILHMAPISFDASTLEVWGALLHGARCVLFPERIPTPKRIGVVVRQHKVTTAWLTASLFNAVIDEAPEELQGIEQIMTGGEALSVAHIRRALDVLPGTQLINGYGPTESTTFACCYPVPKHLSESTRSISIGRPIGNTQTYIVDRHLQPVPVGISGELYIGGAGLARGYFNRPDLTHERFVTHPFSSEPDARLYKTGDLARYLPDGTIEFLGRIDHQVKVRGFRIELGEIEEVLRQQPEVREAVVVVREDIPGDKYLVAYVVVALEQFTSITALPKMLREQLPEYMIPSAFIPLEALPLTPSGKVDRLALPAPKTDRHTAEGSFVSPTHMVHYQLQAIWEELLQVHPIGMRDNFFDLGGHSLLAARLVARIEQICGKKLALSTLFTGPTIEQVAEAFEREEGPRPRTPIIAVQARGTKRPFFFLHGDTTGGAFYCFPLVRDLGGDQPFYALEPYQFEDLPVPPPIDRIAAAHIEALRAVQPEGPYLLGGFCNGALIVYEMAQQLQAQGLSVNLLVLIDPLKLPRLRSLHHTIGRISTMIHLSRKKQLDWFLRLRHLYLFFHRRKMLEENPQLAAEDTWFTSLFPRNEVLRQDYAGTFSWLTSQYVLRPYSGKTTILWAREETFDGVWKQKVEQEPQIEFRFIPGTHMSCRTEHLHGLAEQLQACLFEAQQAQNTSKPLSTLAAS